MAETIENSSLRFVDTAKQSFFDFILGTQIVGYEIDKAGGQGDPIVKPILVHGNYRDIYNKLMNAQLVIGTFVPGVSLAGDVIGQTVAPFGMVLGVCIDKKHMVGGMPLIRIEMPSTQLPEDTTVYLDRYNRGWNASDHIPVDSGKSESEPDLGDLGSLDNK